MEWYLMALRRYADFSGRSRRREYWMFFVCNIGIIIGLSIIDMLTGLVSQSAGIGLVTGLYGLAVLIPGIAVAVRRLHDTGKSGWWMLIGLVPFVGGIIGVIFMATPGTPGPNAYGSDPKAGRAAAAAMVI